MCQRESINKAVSYGGAWIEIYSITSIEGSDERRIAHAVRGLKFCPVHCGKRSHTRSHRSRGAWIEISKGHAGDVTQYVASLTRCVD